jgi:sphingomyelin phosphodiesterase acid-like 3
VPLNFSFVRTSFALWYWVGIFVFLLPGNLSQAQTAAREGKTQRAVQAAGKQDSTIAALLISDIQFVPFQEPEKARQLVREPVSQWGAILASAASPDQAQAFAGLQKACHAKGVDTPYPLFESSLEAMHKRAPYASFITVTGDLIAHAFSCRYTTLTPGSTAGNYQEFVEKTIEFVVGQLRATFRGVPVYISLGNNDTDCGDYRLDAGGGFLAKAATIVASGVPASAQREVLQEFPAGGYFSLTMAAPMRNTRLIVLNDLFLSPRYSTCKGALDDAPGNAEMGWLESQLAQARQLGQKAWVMGHIPPGVNTYATVSKFKDVCAGEDAEMFLNSGRLDTLLVEYADVVRLGLFAHTHMDEMRLITPEGPAARASVEHSVALKLVPSISPVDGNNPSFTIARVDPSTAVLRDYEVIVASNQTGIDTTWTEEYDYARSYHQPEFSPSAVTQLIGKFSSDPRAETEPSQEYNRHYFKGDLAGVLTPFWPQYVCSLESDTARGYAACVCAAVK